MSSQGLRYSSVILMGILAACGSTDPVPNPPSSAPPAAVIVQQGDNQTAVAGTAVPIVPSVVVHDVNGDPVANIAVTFMVDSGGGVVGNATVNTNASGVASAGIWTLGPAGPQVLSAGASYLTRQKIRATSIAPTGTITPVTQTIAPTGGAILISQPGSPFNGTTLTFMAGALTSPTPVKIGSMSTAGFQLPAGMTLPATALTLTSSVGALSAPAFLRLPVPAASRANAVIVWKDLQTGALQILPRASSDSSSITVLVPTLDFSPATTSGVVGALRSFFRADDGEVDGAMLLAQLPADVPTRAFDSRFTPGADDWDFADLAIAGIPSLVPAGSNTVDFELGETVTELWYYVNKRKSGSLPLSGSTQLLRGEPKSSRDGIRWAAMATQDVPPIYLTRTFLLRRHEEFFSDDPVDYEVEQFLAIRAQFFITSSRPVPILLSEAAGASGIDLLGIAISIEGNTLAFSTAEQPGVVLHATLNSDGTAPVDVPTVTGRVAHIRSISSLMYAVLVQEDKLADGYAKVVAHTIGQNLWPDVQLMAKGEVLDTGRVFIDEPLQHWWECAQCQETSYHPDQLPSTANHIQAMQFGSINNGVWTGLGNAVGSARFTSTLFSSGVSTRSAGFVVEFPVPQSDGSVGATWLDWRTATYRKLTLTATPAAVQLAGTQTIAFSVTPDVAPPTATRYSWVLVTSAGRDSVQTATPSFSKQITSGTTGTLLVQAHEPGTNRIISHVEIPIVSGAAPFWKMTAFTDQDRLFSPDNDPGGTVADALTKVLASPGRGLIAVTESGTTTELSLRVKNSGVWASTDCCPPGFVPADAKIIMGVAPATTNTYGPFFTAFASNIWSQSTTDLTAGTVSGKFAVGSINYPVFNAGTQAGPEYAVKISATRSGNTMTGTITFTIFFVGDDDNKLHPDDVDEYRFPFTAVLLKQ